jgi:hypothetical protein
MKELEEKNRRLKKMYADERLTAEISAEKRECCARAVNDSRLVNSSVLSFKSPDTAGRKLDLRLLFCSHPRLTLATYQNQATRTFGGVVRRIRTP